MATFPQASRASTPRASQSRPPASLRSHSSHTKSLPDAGSCNFRDIQLFGVNAPSCSCQRFFRNPHRREESVDGEFEYLYCACGHHVCFHSQSTSRSASPVTKLIELKPGLYAEADRLSSEDRNRLEQADGQFFTPRRRGEFTRSLSGDTTVDDGQQSIQDLTIPTAEHAGSPVLREGGSGLPSIPDVCRWDSDEFKFGSTRRGSVTGAIGTSMRESNQQIGDLLSRPAMSPYLARNPLDTMPPPEKDRLQAWHRTLEQAQEGSQMASTVRYSSTDVESQRPRNSPNPAFLESVMQAKRAATQTSARAAGVQSEAVLNSATELATPSVANTPDLRAYDQHIQETHSLINDVVREIGSAENGESTTHQGNRGALSPTQPDATQLSQKASGLKTPASQAGSDRSLSKSTPSALRRLAPQLLALQKHLAAQPNISTTMQNFSDRLWMLENASFQHVPPEEIDEKFELMDGRILDAEYRLNELEQQFSIMQEEKEEKGNASKDPIEDDMSNPKSILDKVLDQTSKYVRLSEIEQRLEDLEAAVPSDSNPWEIEVVLLPWGRDLHGIWYTQDELAKHDHSISQSSQESNVLRLLQPPSSPSMSNDIRSIEWTGEAPEFLYPRASGPKSKIWHRLKSRGMIKTVTIRDPTAQHILTTISEAFGNDVLRGEEGHSQLTNDSEMTDIPDEMPKPPPFAEGSGLRAPVIPLRKIRRDAQLLFLGPSDLVTPSLWTAQFLSTGMIHFASGKRRLFVTTPDAYLQSNNESSAWTWPKIKALPLVAIPLPADDGAQIAEGNEPWWIWNPRYDTIDYASSVNPSDNSQCSISSFRSESSIALRPAVEQLPSPQSASVATNQEDQYTWKSEPLAPRPPRSFRRTVSAPTTQVITSTRRTKRRIDEESLSGLDRSPSPYSLEQAASCFIPRDSNKRRRVSRSPSREHDDARNGDDAATAGSTSTFYGQNFTPRPTPTTEVPVPYMAEGAEIDLRKVGTSPSANLVKGPTGFRGSEAYNTPFSYSPKTTRPRPPHYLANFSDTEADDNDGDGEGSGAEANNEEMQKRKRDVQRDKNRSDCGSDEEMADAQEEWHGIQDEDDPLPEEYSQDAGSVDFVKPREKTIKREDDDDEAQTDNNDLYGHPPLFHPPAALPPSRAELLSRYVRRGGA